MPAPKRFSLVQTHPDYVVVFVEGGKPFDIYTPAKAKGRRPDAIYTFGQPSCPHEQQIARCVASAAAHLPADQIHRY